MSLDKESLRSFAERLVAEHRGGDADPVPAIGVTASDVLAMLTEIERLTAQVHTLQSDANSWQSGYDAGRCMGTKTAYSERDQLKTENAALHKDADRYRYMRDFPYNNCARAVGITDGRHFWLQFEAVDQAVDKAMADDAELLACMAKELHS